VIVNRDFMIFLIVLCLPHPFNTPCSAAQKPAIYLGKIVFPLYWRENML